MGRPVAAGLQCGYHGMTFDATGACVEIPGQARIPANARVRAYPTVESNGLVWLWMGAPELAATVPVYDQPEFHDHAWAVEYGTPLAYDCSYFPLAENLCDPVHVNYVHPSTLGSTSGAEAGVEAVREGDVVTTVRWTRDASPIGFFAEFGLFEGNVDRWQYYIFHAPATSVIDFGSLSAAPGARDDARGEGFRVYALHFLTPVDEHRTIDFWLTLRNWLIDDDTVGPRMSALLMTAFAEDKAVLEAIEVETRLRPAAPAVRLAVDKGATLLRRVIEEKLAAE